ncbi:MAG: DUF4384 domain-containing protein [Planctomycetaceae bacterium]|nr:DUF4384 domain-containing protein [Planctomycetaceae bacterium]
MFWIARRGALLAALLTLVASVEITHAEESTFRDLVRTFVLKSTAEGKSRPTSGGPLAMLPEGLDQLVALEYTVLKRTPTGEEPVDASQHHFRIGDQVRLRIKPLSGLYIYIFHEGASGHRTCLLPTEKETPPLAQPDKSLDLPADGSVFEFAPPAGDEKLIVVALEKPSQDLATLSDVIFKKPTEQLTDEDKKIQATLRAKHDQTLKSILERQAQGTRYRGLFTDEALSRVAKQASAAGATRALFEEPPHGTTTSTLAMSAARRDAGQGELFVTIPLKSTGK